jgi:hypothetical protein
LDLKSNTHWIGHLDSYLNLATAAAQRDFDFFLCE